MRLGRTFLACAAAIALMSTAAQAATCNPTGVTIDLTTSPTAASSCGGFGGGTATFDGSGSDTILGQSNTAGYSFINSTSIAAFLGVTSFTSSASSPSGYNDFILAFSGQDGGGAGWAYFFIPGSFDSSIATISGTFNPIFTGAALYGLAANNIGNTPLPSSFVLLATILAGAWGVRRWQRRGQSNRFITA